jgi:hypothetical protein
MTSEKWQTFHGIKILAGPHTHPGSGDAQSHESEYLRFSSSLNLLNSQEMNPTMLEIGAFWALWSLVCRKRFPLGKSILIEYGSHQLSTGRRNFELNGFQADYIHGGIFLRQSGTAQKVQDDVAYELNGVYGIPGPDLNVVDTLMKYSKIDLIHLDIQGSERLFLELFFRDNLYEKLKNQVLIVCTHSARNHRACKKLGIKYGYLIAQEESTYGKFGFLIFRIFRFIGQSSIIRVFNHALTQKVIGLVELIFDLQGQTKGFGRDGWLVMYREC